MHALLRRALPEVRAVIAENSGHRRVGLGSPKLSLIFGPWAKTEFFVNYGHGFHSNDARGTTATDAAKPDADSGTRPAVDRTVPLVRSTRAASSACAPRSFPAYKATK
jgi:hypothetical protein